MTKIKEISIDDLGFDKKNANKGTDLGKELLKTSVSKHGAGRGVLADKHLDLIAGNHAVKEMKAQGIKKVVVVQTEGDTLVVTQRMDIDLNTKEGRELALADNRVNQANLSFDVEVIAEFESVLGVDLESMAINLHGEGPVFPGPNSDEDSTDEAEQMETFQEKESGGGESKNQITQNLFPVMAALTKAERLKFDAFKKQFDAANDTATILELMKNCEDVL